CGECKARLAPSDAPLEVAPAAFDEIVGESPVPVLVDFWAPWCGPCRAVAPEVGKAAGALSGRAVVLKVNTEQHPELAARFGVQGIPYFAVFAGGKRVAEQTGAVGHQRLVSLVAGAGTRPAAT
ncbi:MAG TPA: thioredoxin domain-containing protein, partial [Polyangiaceae bacterium]|nr:thioredoxin domain-containing protein [Polyangiaceae bacterium]